LDLNLFMQVSSDSEDMFKGMNLTKFNKIKYEGALRNKPGHTKDFINSPQEEIKIKRRAVLMPASDTYIPKCICSPFIISK
jgi:hypothetical protein